MSRNLFPQRGCHEIIVHKEDSDARFRQGPPSWWSAYPRAHAIGAVFSRFGNWGEGVTEGGRLTKSFLPLRASKSRWRLQGEAEAGDDAAWRWITSVFQLFSQLTIRPLQCLDDEFWADIEDLCDRPNLQPLILFQLKYHTFDGSEGTQGPA
jgi:hypothetical protein